MSGYDVAAIIISFMTIATVIIQVWRPGFPFSLKRRKDMGL